MLKTRAFYNHSSARHRQIFRSVVVVATVLSAGGVALAVDTSWVQPGKPVSAAAMTAALTDLQNQINALSAASSTTPPPGTIAAYAGTTAPSGWLMCDGTPVLVTDYPALYKVLQTSGGAAFGAPSASSFNLPDLRGRFLRGVDQGTHQDPEAAKGTQVAPNGNTGDSVGSLESDALQGHWHNIRRNDSPGYFLTMNAVFGSGGFTSLDMSSTQQSLTIVAKDIVSDGTNGSPRISSETRPSNIAVNFIIKF